MGFAGVLRCQCITPRINHSPQCDTLHKLCYPHPQSLICAHRKFPANLEFPEAMAEAHTSSRKRTNGLNVLANESLYHCSRHNGHSHQPGTRNPKRLKPEPRLRSPAQPAAPVGSIDSRSPNLQGDSFEIHRRTSTDINSCEDEITLLPPITSTTTQRYLTFNGQHLPQQDLGTPNSVFGTPASYTATNDTLSPGPFSLNGATVVEASGVASQSPGNANELSFDNHNDFSLEFPPEWQWNPLDGGELPFDGSGISSYSSFLTLVK